MSTEILYKEDLDNMRCDCGSSAQDEPVYLHSSCHIEFPTWCAYFNGHLVITCAKCGKPILVIKIASNENAKD